MLPSRAARFLEYCTLSAPNPTPPPSQIRRNPATHHGPWTMGGRWAVRVSVGKLPHRAQVKAWKGAARHHLCSSVWLSNTIGTRRSGVFELKGALFENPSRCQRNSLFHISSLPKAGSAKKNKYHGLLKRGGSREQCGVGLLRMRSGRRGQQRRASLLSDRVTNKHLPAVGNLALKACQATNTWYGQKGCVV